MKMRRRNERNRQKQHLQMNFVALRAYLIKLIRCKILILSLNIQIWILVYCSSKTKIPKTKDRRDPNKRHKKREVLSAQTSNCCYVLCVCVCSLFNGRYILCFKMNVRNCFSSLLFFHSFFRRFIKSFCVNICCF